MKVLIRSAKVFLALFLFLPLSCVVDNGIEKVAPMIGNPHMLGTWYITEMTCEGTGYYEIYGVPTSSPIIGIGQNISTRVTFNVDSTVTSEGDYELLVNSEYLGFSVSYPLKNP